MASNHLQDDEDSFEKFLNSDKVVSIVNLLTKFKIKLWELPNLELPDSQSQVEDLLMKMSDESGLIEDELKEILIKLQKHAIKKLEENKIFNTQGIATFKIKIIGNNSQKQSKILNETFETCIQVTGTELKNMIISKYNLNCDSLKIICNGKVIKEDSFLSSQDIKNHSTLLVMCVYQRVAQELAQSSQDYKLISDIKDAVNLLTDNKLSMLNSSKELKLQNQNGISLDVSENDNKCLTTAMILHEKAKISIKSKEYLKALILLAEADNEFKSCTDRSLLERVDNYALLNLDIIWCYLCLQNLHELKNAEERMNTCERALQKCYGSDLARLTTIKSETVNKHTPIFVRLNLLKAILNYHKGKKRECRQFLDIASKEMQKITIDDDKLIQVMSMGFTSTEAKLALRATFNDVDAAVEQIFKKKQMLKESKILEKQKERAKNLESKYGRTMNGNKPIDIKVLDDLIQFGYTESQAAKALIRASNDFNLALDILQTDINENNFENEKMEIPDLENIPISDEYLSQLNSMGYDLELCKLCLTAFGNNFDKAINYFLENKNDLFDPESLKRKLEKLVNKSKISNTDEKTRENDSKPSTSKQTLKEELEKAMNAQKLLNNLAEEMPDDDEAYLDFNTEEDAFYIKKYYSLLES